MRSQVRKRTVFERILFSTSWEDPAMDLEAFKIRQDQDVILSITSGGDKILCLLVERPKKIIALDMSSTQTALLELKMAGIRGLDHGAYLELLGVRPSKRIRELYASVRGLLSPEGAGYWDTYQRILEKGVLTQGRFEKYFSLFRLFLKWLEGNRRIRTFFTFDRLEDQRDFYFREWNSTPWKLFFKVFFSRPVLGALGLDKEFFKYVEEKDFARNFYAKAQHAFTDLPLRTNYFMAQILLGRYLNEEEVPAYLKKENFEILRENLSRIEIRLDEAERFFSTLPDNCIDKFDFTNIFEWIDEATFERMLREAVRVATPGAVMTYRNTLVPRSHPPSLDHVIESDRALAKRLHFEDRSFFYSNFVVERVRKQEGNEPGGSCAS